MCDCVVHGYVPVSAETKPINILLSAQGESLGAGGFPGAQEQVLLSWDICVGMEGV